MKIDDQTYPDLRPIMQGDEVSVTLPLAMWWCIFGWYKGIDGACEEMDNLCNVFVRKVTDPRYVKELDAHIQEAHDNSPLHKLAMFMATGGELPTSDDPRGDDIE